MLAELLEQSEFRDEYQRHQRARHENQPLLEDRIEEIQQGQALDALEPFAKAYLGMFYDIDSNITPEARIYLLVDEPLVEPIMTGLYKAIQHQAFPAPAEIAEAMVADEPLGMGYIALAGVDLFLHQQGGINALQPATLKSVLCFHYANSTYHQDEWLIPLLKEAPAVAADAYTEFWQVLADKGLPYLPGLQLILEHEALSELRAKVIVTAVSLMRNKRPKELARMLLAALEIDKTEPLYEMACTVLQQPEAIGIRQQVYWQATAFILEPAARGNILSGFVGQEKIKILPLLDFINWVLQANPQRLSGEAIGELIRIIAPKFTPQKDNYGNLSDITLKVTELFYLLAINPTLPAMQVTKKLRRVRVLKLYSEVLDEVEALQTKLATDELTEPPQAEEFIQHLQATGKLKSKKKWSDTNY